MIANKRYKLYLVEMDDTERERVIEAEAMSVEMEVSNDYADISSYTSNRPVMSFLDRSAVTITIALARGRDGAYYKFVNFTEEEEDDE